MLHRDRKSEINTAFNEFRIDFNLYYGVLNIHVLYNAL